MSTHNSPSDTRFFRGPNGEIAGMVQDTPHAPDFIEFRAATAQQVSFAIRESEKGNSPVAIDLAKQGLYAENDATIFHPDNVKWLSDAIGLFCSPTNDINAVPGNPTDVEPYLVPDFLKKGPGSQLYSIRASFLEQAIRVLEKNPSLMWIN